LSQPFDLTPRSSSALRGLQKPVIDGIGRSIVGGQFLPGAILPTEPELGEQYQVSRTSVREAMRVLAAKGLVEIRQKVGTRVQDREHWNIFDSDILRWHNDEGKGNAVMRDLIELRQVLEPAAAKLAAGRATIADHGKLLAAINAMENSIESSEKYAEADVEFHLAVYSSSHNSLMRQFGNVVAEFLIRAFTLQQRVIKDSRALIDDVQLHREVYEAINRGEGEAAAHAMLTVVLEGKSSLIQAIDGLAAIDPGGD
jgi:GntR family galactonate operon transcriptional repressor